MKSSKNWNFHPHRSSTERSSCKAVFILGMVMSTVCSLDDNNVHHFSQFSWNGGWCKSLHIISLLDGKNTGFRDGFLCALRHVSSRCYSSGYAFSKFNIHQESLACFLSIFSIFLLHKNRHSVTEELKKRYAHESHGLKNGYTISRMEKGDFSGPLGFSRPWQKYPGFSGSSPSQQNCL